MASSTSSSKDEVFDRFNEKRFGDPVLQKPWLGILLSAVLMNVVALGAWELYWRNQGYEPGYVNSDGFWSYTRRRIGENGTRDVAIIGTSRAFYDLDLQVMSQVLGSPVPIQLSLEGTSPRFLFTDLASDPEFKGLLVVGVAPLVFYSETGGERDNVLEYYRNESPSELAGQLISMAIEPNFVFLDRDISFNMLMWRMPWWPETPGVSAPGARKLEVLDRNRDAKLWKRVSEDTEYNKMVRDFWSLLTSSPPPELTDQQLADLFDSVAENVTAIRERGGNVVFVSFPVSGPYLENETKYRPRERFWDPMIEKSQTLGINWQDYPELTQFKPAEWSHLPASAKSEFTRIVTEMIKREYQGADGAPSNDS